jgi:hypothetical protein
VSTGIGVCVLAAGNDPIFDRGDVVMPTVADLKPVGARARLEQGAPPAAASWRS